MTCSKNIYYGIKHIAEVSSYSEYIIVQIMILKQKIITAKANAGSLFKRKSHLSLFNVTPLHEPPSSPLQLVQVHEYWEYDNGLLCWSEIFNWKVKNMTCCNRQKKTMDYSWSEICWLVTDKLVVRLYLRRVTLDSNKTDNLMALWIK